MAVAPNGDLYVALMPQGGGRGGTPTIPGGVVALRDADGDGKFALTERFGNESTTGHVARADGVEQAPDGLLYIPESQKGKI